MPTAAPEDWIRFFPHKMRMMSYELPLPRIYDPELILRYSITSAQRFFHPYMRRLGEKQILTCEFFLSLDPADYWVALDETCMYAQAWLSDRAAVQARLEINARFQ